MIAQSFQTLMPELSNCLQEQIDNRNSSGIKMKTNMAFISNFDICTFLKLRRLCSLSKGIWHFLSVSCGKVSSQVTNFYKIKTFPMTGINQLYNCQTSLMDHKVVLYNDQHKCLVQHKLSLTHILVRLGFHNSEQNCKHQKKNG